MYCSAKQPSRKVNPAESEQRRSSSLGPPNSPPKFATEGFSNPCAYAPWRLCVKSLWLDLTHFCVIACSLRWHNCTGSPWKTSLLRMAYSVTTAIVQKGYAAQTLNPVRNRFPASGYHFHNGMFRRGRHRHAHLAADRKKLMAHAASKRWRTPKSKGAWNLAG